MRIRITDHLFQQITITVDEPVSVALRGYFCHIYIIGSINNFKSYNMNHCQHAKYVGRTNVAEFTNVETLRKLPKRRKSDK